MKICVVIPTYNEKENVRAITEKIFSMPLDDLEIIFVDDGSPDGTAPLIKELQHRFPIHLIERPKKMGIGSAYVAGFKHALRNGAEYIFEMDADLSHDPLDIPKLLAAAEGGVDLVIGSRRVPGGKIVGWNLRRHLTSLGATWLSSLLLGLKTKDVTAGFRCYRRAVLEKFNLDKIKSGGYAFQEETLYRAERAGFKIIEVPVTFYDRKAGKSKLSKKDIIEFFWIILKLRADLKNGS